MPRWSMRCCLCSLAPGYQSNSRLHKPFGQSCQLGPSVSLVHMLVSFPHQHSVLSVHVFLPAALHCSSHMRVVSRNTTHHVSTLKAFSHAHEVTISQIHQRKRADDERRSTRNAQSSTEMTYIVILPKHRPSSHE
jgi:hypothetical protein